MEFYHAGVDKWKQINFQHLYFLDNQRTFVKGGDVSKKSGVMTDLLKLQNPGEVVILAKSAIFAYN